MSRLGGNRAASVAAVVALGVTAGLTGHLHWYGALTLALLGWKVVLAAATPDPTGEPPAMDVAVIVPTYNEDPAYLLAGLRSLLAQTYRPAAVCVIDDGSTDPTGADAADALAPAFAAAGIAYVVLRQANAGKRHALAAGFRAFPDVAAYLCVDSDTVLDPAALHEALRPFADPRVTASTGLVLAANHDRNVLTRLIDLRYACAFLVERAAYSALGSVLCCCGSLAVYRADVVHKHLDAFLGQRFLGQPATFGDDRHMTNLCLLEGRTVFTGAAIAHTAVPERFGHYLRQQVRWNKSFFRESLWVLSRMPMGPALLLTALEIGAWLLLTAMVSYAIVWRPFTDGLILLAIYAGWVGIIGWVRSVRALGVRRAGVSRRSRARAFALAPLYGLMHVLVLVPLRLYALATLHHSGWGTRAAGAEVTLAGGPATLPEAVRGEESAPPSGPLPRAVPGVPAGDGGWIFAGWADGAVRAGRHRETGGASRDTAPAWLTPEEAVLTPGAAAWVAPR